MTDRILRGFVAACSISLFSACGGTQHIREITPPMVARLSGTWTLNAAESDDSAQMMARRGGRGEKGGDARGGGAQGRRGRGGGGAGKPPGGGGMPGGGMGGGRGGATPRGGMARGGEGRSGGPNPEAMKALRQIAMTNPARLDVQLADSVVTLTYAGDADPYILPFGQKVERKLSDDLTLETEASWEDGRVVVERSLEGSGSVREMFMPSVDGKRLVVDVAITGGLRGGIEFQRIYDRGSPGS